MSRYVAFIVRMQLDEQDPRQPDERPVRGSLRQVGTEEIHYFSSCDEITGIFMNIAATTEPPPGNLAERL